MDDSGSTRTRLILAAERLFAERGIDGVSLRQINLAAGQRNASASHYHFGSKEALIAAVLEYRMEGVNRRRVEMLDALEAGGGGDDLHALVETLVYPLAEQLDSGEGHYLGFLAQVTGHPRSQVARVGAGRLGVGVTRTAQAIRNRIDHVPDALFGQRFLLAVTQVIHALAGRQRLSRAPGVVVEGNALFVSNLVDTVTGALAAPVSPNSQRELHLAVRAPA